MTPQKGAELPVVPAQKERPEPLYAQVEADLKRLMDVGTLPAGALLPPEHDLCRLYGVSRHTVRTALSRLASAKRISRSAGRGTVVQPKASPATFYLDRSFTHQMAYLGRQARSSVLRQTSGVVGEGGAEPFRAKVGAPCFNLTRLRFGDDEPIALQHALVLTDRCPGIAQFDWSVCSLYEVQARHYRLVITEIEHTIGVAAADAEQARLLGIDRGRPLLRVETAAFLTDHEIIEHTTSYYRGDRYLYRTVHTLS